ncbi:unnamed protein product [Adineta ricciae]|uniref:Uncharacterized protein n=1 Tax=Adineta ricciae TaxID=249248 RepID=A0A816DPG1_ADIRI|nr:unnamed protein product [Adineta ricciae]CAF1635607.1 unnamed protein product [Adineta ricciae]
MSKQSGFILLCCFIILIDLCASAPSAEREKRGAGAGNCNGGRGVYKTFCYGNRNGDKGKESDAQLCLDALMNASSRPWGCSTVSHGRCRCTVDSSYIFGANGRWAQTYREARANLHRECFDFTHNIMERYEGNLYLALTCN